MRTSIEAPLSAVVVTAAVLALVSASALSAAPGKRCPGCNGPYDPATEITVAGTVDEVVETTGKRGWTGIHLVVTTDDETWEVHVGPAHVLAEHELAFEAGDEIEITGSDISGDDSELIARTVTSGEKTVTLRDADGRPVWAGQGREQTDRNRRGPGPRAYRPGR